MKSLSFPVALIGLLVASPLAAQSSAPIKLGLGGGLTAIAGEDRDFYKDGFNVQGMASYDLSSVPLTARLDVMYHRLGGRNLSDQSDPNLPDTLLIGSFSTVAAALTASYQLTSYARPVQPYVNFGLGLYRSEQNGTLYNQPATATSTDLGLVGGLGISFGTGGSRFFAEARVHNIFGDGGSGRIYPFTVGGMFGLRRMSTP